jgi:hypothetical protein
MLTPHQVEMALHPTAASLVALGAVVVVVVFLALAMLLVLVVEAGQAAAAHLILAMAGAEWVGQVVVLVTLQVGAVEVL